MLIRKMLRVGQRELNISLVVFDSPENMPGLAKILQR